VPGGGVGLAEHLDRWGPPPIGRGSALIDEIGRSGLRGRGGGWFPAGTKWRSVRSTGLRRPVVVANASEGEPASRKDHFLITQQPHLVLDGAMLAAAAVGASQVLVHVPRSGLAVMTGAIEERARRGLDSCAIDTVVASGRYLAGQESAVVNTINGLKPDTPGFVALRPVRDRGIGGRPTLVQNVETLAHASLIARFGADWFREAGTAESPGTTLLTVSGQWPEPRIVELALGTPLGHALGLDPDASSSIQGVLLGGYGGGWIRSAEALSMPFTEETARQNGSSIGAGVVALLPKGLCPLLEVSRVVRYLQGEAAGQCGPCINGLAVLATTMETLVAEPSRLRLGVSGIPALCQLVEGRGACAHPDGVARFVRSALDVFSEHADIHLRRGPCHTTAPPFLPILQRQSRNR
jgi:NADH:ubiquinone oxidoreductase subunit F (NADH-binding)